MADLKMAEKNVEIIVSIGVVLGIGLIILGEFQGISGITTAANTAIGNVVTELSGITTWLGIIIVAFMAAIAYAAYKKRK